MCHFGLDTLSWARLGANVTGVDFSEESIKIAKKLQQEWNIPAKFINCNIYDLKNQLTEQFDIVYTGIGVLGWLKSLEKWAQTITDHLKPGRLFYMFESHPILNIFEETYDKSFIRIKFPYFHNSQPLQNNEWWDYADNSVKLEMKTYEWQWSISDILNSLIKAGLRIKFLHEFDKLFNQRFPNMIYDDSDSLFKGWYLPELKGKIPLSFSVLAEKE